MERANQAVIVRLDQVEAREAQWLWPAYVPIGKLTLLDGDGDVGKSTLCLDLAARVTTGRSFPDGSPCEAGGAVILSAEDDIEDSIRPRLDAAEADSSRIACLAGIRAPEGTVSPSLSDLDALEEAVRLVGAKVVLVDTLVDFFGAKSLLNPQSVRGVLLPLIALAKRRGFAVIALRHFTKTGKTLLSKGAGSTAIAAVSRSGLFVVKDPNDDTRRILGSYKHNAWPSEPAALRFRFVTERGAGRIAWEGPAEPTADALFSASMENERLRTARREAKDFLAEALGHGPVPSSEVVSAGKAHGIAPRTLERARRDLGVVSERQGGRTGTWYLRLLEPPIADLSSKAGGEAKDRHDDTGGLGRSCPLPGSLTDPPTPA